MRQRSRYFLKDALVVLGEPIEAGRLEGEGRREAADRVERGIEEGFRKLIRH
jgi:hypothetical protein